MHLRYVYICHEIETYQIQNQHANCSNFNISEKCTCHHSIHYQTLRSKISTTKQWMRRNRNDKQHPKSSPKIINAMSISHTMLGHDNIILLVKKKLMQSWRLMGKSRVPGCYRLLFPCLTTHLPPDLGYGLYITLVVHHWEKWKRVSDTCKWFICGSHFWADNQKRTGWSFQKWFPNVLFFFTLVQDENLNFMPVFTLSLWQIFN